MDLDGSDGGGGYDSILPFAIPHSDDAGDVTTPAATAGASGSSRDLAGPAALFGASDFGQFDLHLLAQPQPPVPPPLPLSAAADSPPSPALLRAGTATTAVYAVGPAATRGPATPRIGSNLRHTYADIEHASPAFSSTDASGEADHGEIGTGGHYVSAEGSRYDEDDDDDDDDDEAPPDIMIEMNPLLAAQRARRGAPAPRGGLSSPARRFDVPSLLPGRGQSAVERPSATAPAPSSSGRRVLFNGAPTPNPGSVPRERHGNAELRRQKIASMKLWNDAENFDELLCQDMMDTLDWNDVVAKLIRVRSTGNEDPDVQNSRSEKLDTFAIANRIMRKDNYLIGLFNKDLLDLKLPYLGNRQILVSFIAGAFAAALAAVTIIDKDILVGFEISPGGSVLFYITVFGGILAVKNEFAILFDVKIVVFLQEIFSVLYSPIILYYSLPRCSEDIIDFFRDFTLQADSVGYVCSFAAFNLRSHGNPMYGAPSAAADHHLMSKEGKMEQSFLFFKTNNPQWEPGADGNQYLQTLNRASRIVPLPDGSPPLEGSHFRTRRFNNRASFPEPAVRPVNELVLAASEYDMDDRGLRLIGLLDAVYQAQARSGR
ncbi:autophagy protein atg9 [Cladochytrium tenue]|nr:autophagy protein atg9 [Cladochytrium tenue]